ncbi:MAG: secondary thiamine-phosphate synthase enzyme YjbQ [Firmicutes bacterium]|nr:secondary thiamine-phosphate synthase enzyme YjbQ [Bacillota bacterium]
MWSEIIIATQERVQLVDVTTLVSRELKQTTIRDGICHLFVPHTTAGITVNENADPDVVTDIIRTLERLIPREGNYRHREGNSDAHLKASLVGFSCEIPIISGNLALGTWQGIYFCEFDGPRRRKIKIGFQNFLDWSHSKEIKGE